MDEVGLNHFGREWSVLFLKRIELVFWWYFGPYLEDDTDNVVANVTFALQLLSVADSERK